MSRFPEKPRPSSPGARFAFCARSADEFRNTVSRNVILVWELLITRHVRKANYKLEQETPMLRAALLFLVLALIAGFLGLFRVEYVAAEIAWVLFVVFVVLAIVSAVIGRGTPRSLD